MFFLLGFFSMCMYFVGYRLMQNKPLTEKDWNLFPHVFSTFGAQLNHKWRRQQQWHLTKDFICTLAFILLHIYPLLYEEKIRECDNQKFKVLRTQTFNRITSNSKRARTKFKLIGKFKMLRKFKQQKAFPARSLHLFAFVCKQQEKY